MGHKKANLKDVLFIIPIKIDSNDRLENTYLQLEYLTHHLDTNIVVGEEESKDGKYWLEDYRDDIDYLKFPADISMFYKAKILNKAYKSYTHPIVVICDVDVLCRISSYIKAADMIRSGEYQIVCPFDGRTASVERDIIPLIKQRLDISVLDKYDLKTNDPKVSLACGAIIFIDREFYINCGMENENFVSYAPDDQERIHRVCKLGGKFGRDEDSEVFHLQHVRYEDSKAGHEYWKQDVDEWHKVRDMTKGELLEYIDTWNWV